MGLRQPPQGEVHPVVEGKFPKAVGTYYHINVQTVVRELKEQGIEDLRLTAYFLTDDVVYLGVYGIERDRN